MRVVLRIGGSVVASPINTELVNKYANILRKLRQQGHDVAVVVGGGSLAREFISIAKRIGLNEQAQDELAISISRVFAQLFIKKLGELSGGEVPLAIDGAAECLGKGRVFIMGGLKPGMTTDSVAALIAERLNADLLVKGTDQDGIYNKDPRKHSGAVKIDCLSFDDLRNVLSESKHKAGINQVVDPEAIEILKRQQVKLVVVNGFEPDNILAAVKGEKIGTMVI